MEEEGALFLGVFLGVFGLVMEDEANDGAVFFFVFNWELADFVIIIVR